MTAVRPVFDPPVFVPAATAERHIAEADAALSALTDEVRRTEAAAAALEGAVGVGFDPGALEFVVVRFDRFVRGLLAETATEIDALVAAVQRRRAPVPLSWDHLFVTDPVVEPGPVAVAVAVVEPGPVPVDVAPPASPAAPVAAATVEVVDPVEDAIEAAFWADDGRQDRWSRLRRTAGMVGLQAAAVLLVLAALLIRIG
jgi:hypothetical protein